MSRITSRGVKWLSGGSANLRDELLEHRSHMRIADDVRVELDIGKLLRHEVEQPGTVEAI